MATGRVIVLRGDAAHLPLPDSSVDLIVTSPPYWQQRDYRDQGESMAGQIGAEETPGEYLEALWACTREWVRILKPEGSLFVNLDDKYATRYSSLRQGGRAGLNNDDDTQRRSGQNRTGVPEKSLLDLPARYSIGCIDRLGLVKRAEIIWRKTSPMPESPRDRVCREHESVFHFTKAPRYFAATDEIRRPLAAPLRKAGASAFGARNASHVRSSTGEYDGQNPLGALPGSVWDIAAEPLNVPAWLGTDHYAAYPTALARRIILGWSPSGVCTECGQGRRPVATAEAAVTKPWALTQRGGRSWHGDGPDPKRTLGISAADRERRITGYSCACRDASAPVRAAVVADPFGGSGTTALTASVLGRTGVSVDRSFDYSRIAVWRTADPAERARALGVPKPPPVIDGQGSLFDGLEAG